MSRDFQQTHENLIACAKKHFLEFGFERASIREICKDANVTNGAFYNHFADKEALFGSLVESVVQTIQKIYSESIDKHFDLVKTDELKNLWKLSESTIIQIIEYIYENFDVFRLLLMCSSGTKYAGFLDDLVRADVQETIKLIAELKARGVPVNELDVAYVGSFLLCFNCRNCYAQLSKASCIEVYSYAIGIFQLGLANCFGDLIPKIFDWQLAESN